MERLTRAFSVAVVLFFVVLGIVVGSRMDQNTIALLGGVVIGLLVATPFATVITFIAVRSRVKHVESPAWAAPMPNPQYMIMPPAQHGYSLPNTMMAPTAMHTPHPNEGFTLPPRRKFYLIGESGDVSEIEPEPSRSSS